MDTAPKADWLAKDVAAYAIAALTIPILWVGLESGWRSALDSGSLIFAFWVGVVLAVVTTPLITVLSLLASKGRPGFVFRGVLVGGLIAVCLGIYFFLRAIGGLG